MSPLSWFESQRGSAKVTITFAVPLAALLAGFGLRGLLDPPYYTEPPQRQCLLDGPIAVLLNNTLVRATAQPLGPGWIIIPRPGPAPE